MWLVQKTLVATTMSLSPLPEFSKFFKTFCCHIGKKSIFSDFPFLIGFFILISYSFNFYSDFKALNFFIIYNNNFFFKIYYLHHLCYTKFFLITAICKYRAKYLILLTKWKWN